MSLSKIAIMLAHPFLGWALCFATIGIGMALTSSENALIIHAIAAPIIFAIVSYIYFRRFNFTRPLQTAVIFTVFVIAMDFFVVAMLIIRSFAMFTSLLGTWIPFGLIFVSTWLTGLLTVRQRTKQNASSG
jgi:hypothetical protein